MRNYFLREINVTIEKDGQRLLAIKQKIQHTADLVKQKKGHSQLRIVLDVDPL